MNHSTSQYDKMTKTPVPKLICLLSIPTILSMLVTSIYNMADTAFVGQLGTSASGAVGVVFGFMAILQAIGFLYGQGCGSMLSRRLGAKDIEGACRIGSAGFFGSLTTSVVVAILSWILIDPLVYFFGSTATIAPYAKEYLRYILIAAPFMVSSFTLNNILRYEGKASLGAVGMMTGAILNILGDPILIFGFHMGIAGAGISTCVAQIISFSILLSMFLRHKTQTRLTLNNAIAGFRQIPEILGTGLPSLLRQGLASITTILLNSISSPYGDAAIAAMSIVTRVCFCVFSLGLGIGQGFQPVSAYNFGAKKYKRVRQAYGVTVLLAEGIICILTAAALFLSPNIIRIFRDDADVIRIGTRALRLQLITQIALPFCMTTEMLMQSTGKKLAASFLSSTRSGLFFIPSLIILARLRGLAGIQEAQPLAYIISILPAVYCFMDFFRKLPKEDVTEENL